MDKNPFIQFIFILFTLGFVLELQAQNVSLTFKVDMSHEVVSADGVHMAGDFQAVAGLGADWDPGSTTVPDANSDMIFEITVSLPPGTYQYKFINGNHWGVDESPPSDCSVGSTHNRTVTVGAGGLVLPPVIFNACNPLVSFAVTMSAQTVSPAGVHVMGDFQQAAGFANNWDPVSITLQDLNNDGVYEATVSMAPGDYHYLFVNGNTLPDAETPPDACTITGNLGQRQRQFTSSVGMAALPTFYFDSCTVNNPNLSVDYPTYWWNDVVFYELFVRSFYDSNNDGIGDFQGIIQKLDYLNDGDSTTHSDLGIKAIWLMPMMSSPSYHGYDVIDYYATEPDYGTMSDFQELLTKAHARGIKVIIDFVMNHSSDQNAWFTQSVNNENGYRDWYVWSATNPGYLGPWGQTVWYDQNGAYYYALFCNCMPDLNYRHQPLKDEMFNVTKFWLDKGVDGFRLDAIGALVEDGSVQSYTPETLAVLREFNTIYKTKNPDAFTVGEVWAPTATIIPFVHDDRLDACFEFDLAGSILNSVNNSNPTPVRDQLHVVQQAYRRLQFGTFLTNHDMDRVFSQLGSDIGKMKQAASLYLTLPGVPFVYYGEELGMTGAGQDENKRRPMQWSPATNAGFSSATPWETVGDNFATNNVETLKTGAGSLWWHYSNLIRLRTTYPALRRGYFLDVNTNGSLLGYARVYQSEAVIVASNFGSPLSNVSLSLPTSTLSPGTYFVTDLYSSRDMGTVTINGSGGFSNLQPSGQLDSRETWILLISLDKPDIVNSVSSEHSITVRLHPNPTSGQVVVQIDKPDLESGTVELLNVLGNRLYQDHFVGKETVIEIGNLATGLYFVKVTCGEKIITQRLIIDR